MHPYLRPAPHCGRCKKCGRRIQKGESVYYAKKCGMACVSCNDGGTPTPTPAPKAKRAKYPAPTGAMTGEKSGCQCSDGVWRYEFASVGEAVRDALDDYAQNMTTQETVRAKLAYALSGRSEWGNHFTPPQFMAELSKPSEHLTDAVDRMREQLIGEVAAPTAPRRKVRRGQEWGDELDVDRFLSRDPSPWDRNVRERQPRRTVTIGCNLSIDGEAKPEELLYRGAAALALADVLASRGVNVGIVAFYSVGHPTDCVKRGVVKYVLKDPLMPLDLGAITFALCEIAFFRVVGALGALRHWPGKVSWGLGQPAMLPAADRADLDYLVDEDVNGEAQATVWLKGCLAATESEVAHA